MNYRFFGIFTLTACLTSLASATNYVVSTPADEAFNGGTLADETADGTGLSLREAIALANNNAPDGDTLTFSATTFGLSPSLILTETITISDDLAIDGNLGIAGTMTIRGSEASSMPILFSQRLFTIDTAAAPGVKLVSTTNITFQENRTGTDGSAMLIEQGSEVEVGAKTTIRQCTGNNGGAIYNSGKLNVEEAVFEVNTAFGAPGNGGAIYNASNASLSINNTNFGKNRARVSGGAIAEFSGTTDLVSMTRTSFEQNDAGVTFSLGTQGDGGAVYLADGGAMRLIGCTAINNNSADRGGAYWNGRSTMTLSGGEVRRNTASGETTGGGGIFNNGGRLIGGDALEISGNIANGMTGSGGGIFNLGSIDMDSVTLSANRANRAGGGIEHAGGSSNSVRLSRMMFNLNNAGMSPAVAAPGNGGALHITGPGNASILNSVTSRNIAAAEGGAFWNSTGTMIIEEGSIIGNIAMGNAPLQGGGAILNEGGRLRITGVTLTSNSAQGTSSSGGAIYNKNAGALIVSGSRFSQNTAIARGGGIENGTGGEVTISGSTFTENQVGPTGPIGPVDPSAIPDPGKGGAFHATDEGRATFTSCQFTGNTATLEGGGLWNSGLARLTIQHSAITGGNSPAGGGLFQDNGTTGELLVTNSTISGNTGSVGGGIQIEGGNMTLTNITLASNSLNSTGAISINASGGISIIGGSVKTLNSIIADNSPTDLNGSVSTSNNTLLENTTGATGITDGVDGNIVGIDPILEPLANNGGTTLTHLLGCGSPAKNAGSNSFVTGITNDQRGTGFPRIYSGTVDLGALELMVTTYSEWATSAFDPATPEADRLPEANPDGDSRRNAIEYLTGSDPENGTDVDALIAGRDSSDNLIFSYDFVTDRKAGSDGVAISTDLENWDEVMMPDRNVVSGTGNIDRITITLPSSEDKLFARIFLNTP